MSVRVSRSNRAAQPGSPGIRAPGLQKLAPPKGVPANALKANAKYILVNGRYLTVTS